MANKYNNGKIYILTSKQTNKVYIGSTTKELHERFNKHIGHLTHFNKEVGNFHYITSFELIQHDDCEISLLEEVNVETKEELHQYEATYIKSNNNCVNKVIPGQTDHEYYLAHKDKIIAYAKKYAQEHPEATKNNAKKFRETHREETNAKQKEVMDCPCGDTYTRSNKVTHEDSKKHKKFVIDGIVEDKIIIPKNQLIICPCGSNYTYANHLRHERLSDVHKRYVAKKAIADANGVELTMEEIKAAPECDCGYTKCPVTQQRHLTSQQHIIFMKNKAIVEAGGIVPQVVVLPKDKNGRKIKPNVICECGSDFPSRNRKRHEISIKHIEFVAKNNGVKAPIIKNEVSDSEDSSSGIEDEDIVEEEVSELKKKLQLVKKSMENKPVVQKPIENKPIIQKPIEKKPAVNKSIEKKPEVKKSMENKPVVQKPIEKKPIIQKPIEKKPGVKKSIENKPVVQKTEEDKSTVKKPANKQLRKFDL